MSGDGTLDQLRELDALAAEQGAVLAALRAKDAALCVAETEPDDKEGGELKVPFEATASRKSRVRRPLLRLAVRGRPHRSMRRGGGRRTPLSRHAEAWYNSRCVLWPSDSRPKGGGAST